MKSLFTTFPIVAALDTAAGKFIQQLVKEETDRTQPLPLVWSALNQMQSELLAPDIWKPTVAALDKLSATELSSIASWKAEVINDFLRREQFNIQLTPWPEDRQTFGIAGLIKLLDKWANPAETGYTIANYKKAFRMQAGLRFFDYGLPGETGVAIPTRNGDWVHIVRAPAVLTDFPLLRYAIQTTRLSQPTTRYTGAVLPQWKFQEEVDVTGLIGLKTMDVGGNAWRLVQALMEGKSAFGAEGFSFKAAFAAAVFRESMPMPLKPHLGDLVVNYPLVMSIWRPGVSVPLGAVMLEPDDFAYEDVLIDKER